MNKLSRTSTITHFSATILSAILIIAVIIINSACNSANSATTTGDMSGATNSNVPSRLQGKWVNTSEYEGVTYRFIGNFRADSSYDGVLNGKVLVSGGSYVVSGDTVRFRDAVCNNLYDGVYTMDIKDDSLTFHVITDTCRLRRNGTDKMGFKKMTAE